MHQKVMIVDGDLASVGTANMDMRDFQLNFEVNVFFADAEAIRTLEAHFEEDMVDSENSALSAFIKGNGRPDKRILCPSVFRCSVRKRNLIFQNSRCIV